MYQDIVALSTLRDELCQVIQKVLERVNFIVRRDSLLVWPAFKVPMFNELLLGLHCSSHLDQVKLSLDQFGCNFLRGSDHCGAMRSMRFTILLKSEHANDVKLFHIFLILLGFTKPVQKMPLVVIEFCLERNVRLSKFDLPTRPAACNLTALHCSSVSSIWFLRPLSGPTALVHLTPGSVASIESSLSSYHSRHCTGR